MKLIICYKRIPKIDQFIAENDVKNYVDFIDFLIHKMTQASFV